MTKGGSPALSFASGFMQPLSDAITSYANIAVAQAQANAAIITAQQKTQQQALQVNAPIIHELDRPFFNLKGKTGRGKNAPTFNIDLSILGAYALGDMIERMSMDLKEFNEGIDPGWFSREWDNIRTPRTQVGGTATIGEIGIPKPSQTPTGLTDKDIVAAMQTQQQLDILNLEMTLRRASGGL